MNGKIGVIILGGFKCEKRSGKIMIENEELKTRNGEGMATITVKDDLHGIMRLWCELDESFDCVHVQYAWSLKDAQEMYFHRIKNIGTPESGN